MLTKPFLFTALTTAALVIGASGAFAQGLSEPDPSAPLYERLPGEVKERGFVVSATTGRYPPYNFRTEDGSDLQGVSIDLSAEMSKILGVPVRNEIAESVAAFITGVISGRYDFVFGPVADTAERQQSVDMIDWTNQSTSFLVKAGNPKKIESIADTCGLRIATQKASFAEPVLHKQSEICVKEGKPAVEINILPDQAAMALAVQSDRIDASFAGNAALIYFQSQAGEGFEVTGVGDNLMGTLWQAGATRKGSGMTQIVHDAWVIMFENGTYAELMKKWGLEGEMIEAPAINAAK